MLSTRFHLNLQIFLISSLLWLFFYNSKIFIAIKQKKAGLWRKYGDFHKMLSDPFHNIAEQT